jgi:hypothetical protein
MEVKVKHDANIYSEKESTKAFFISASFVYFVLANTSNLITIIG